MRNSSVFVSFPLMLALAIGGAAVVSAPASAVAQAAAPDKKTRDAARKHYADGEKAFDAGKFAEAHELFKKANELIPSAHAEYWIAMALDKQGKEEEATAALEQFLANPSKDKAGADRVKEAEDRLAELKAKQTGEVNVITSPAGAAISVDGQPQMGEAPMIVRIAPGKRIVSISSPGYKDVEREVEVKAGERLDLNVTLELSEPPPEPAPVPEPVAPAPEPPPPPAPKSKVPAYVTLGIAGASTLVGTFFGIKALSAKGEFNDKPTADKADDVERNALIADMAFGVAITLGVTGIVLLTSDDSGEEKAQRARRAVTASRPKLRIAPVIAPTVGGAAAQLTF